MSKRFAPKSSSVSDAPAPAAPAEAEIKMVTLTPEEVALFSGEPAPAPAPEPAAGVKRGREEPQPGMAVQRHAVYEPKLGALARNEMIKLSEPKTLEYYENGDKKDSGVRFFVELTEAAKSGALTKNRYPTFWVENSRFYWGYAQGPKRMAAAHPKSDVNSKLDPDSLVYDMRASRQNFERGEDADLCLELSPEFQRSQRTQCQMHIELSEEDSASMRALAELLLGQMTAYYREKGKKNSTFAFMQSVLAANEEDPALRMKLAMRAQSKVLREAESEKEHNLLRVEMEHRLSLHQAALRNQQLPQVPDFQTRVVALMQDKKTNQWKEYQQLPWINPITGHAMLRRDGSNQVMFNREGQPLPIISFVTPFHIPFGARIRAIKLQVAEVHVLRNGKWGYKVKVIEVVYYHEKQAQQETRIHLDEEGRPIERATKMDEEVTDMLREYGWEPEVAPRSESNSAAQPEAKRAQPAFAASSTLSDAEMLQAANIE
jgi:hypothetical protein